MPDSRIRRLPLVLWIALAGGSLSAVAQQATPGPLMAPALAPKTNLSSATEVTLDNPATGPATTPASSNFQPPKVLNHPTPAYPELAHLNRVEGVVRIHFAIDEAGHVIAATTSKSSGSLMLDTLAADNNLRQWTFQPAIFNGQPVPGGFDQEFEFKLDPTEERALAEKRLALAVGIADPPYPPLALTIHPPPAGKCTVAVRWTKTGLVDQIYMPQSTGSGLLDRAALRFAYTNWRADAATVAKGELFSKVINFTPP